MSVQTKGEATRDRILEAAQTLILEKGYSGATLDDILRATKMTKGAFFHHFKGKADLARAVVERFASRDFALFRTWSERADKLSDDPLERVFIFLRFFEEFLDELGRPFPGCVFASYTYESRQFDAEILAFIRTSLEEWTSLYEEKLEALVKARPPRVDTSARALAEMIVTIIEGGFVMANALDDARWVQRQSAQYRAYLRLLFAPG